jgi:hypothetical protein
MPIYVVQVCEFRALLEIIAGSWSSGRADLSVVYCQRKYVMLILKQKTVWRDTLISILKFAGVLSMLSLRPRGKVM